MTGREHEQDMLTSWSSGVTIKRTTHGYSWTISVAADGEDHLEELRQAVASARQVDLELTAQFEMRQDPRLSRTKPRAGDTEPSDT